MTFENTVHTLHIYFRPIHVNHNTWILGISLILDLKVPLEEELQRMTCLHYLCLCLASDFLLLLVLLVSLPCLLFFLFIISFSITSSFNSSLFSSMSSSFGTSCFSSLSSKVSYPLSVFLKLLSTCLFCGFEL